MAYFNSDWHGVPEGVDVTILLRTKSINGEPLYVVERVDGEQLPGPFVSSPTAYVAAEFINEQ